MGGSRILASSYPAQAPRRAWQGQRRRLHHGNWDSPYSLRSPPLHSAQATWWVAPGGFEIVTSVDPEFRPQSQEGPERGEHWTETWRERCQITPRREETTPKLMEDKHVSSVYLTG